MRAFLLTAFLVLLTAAASAQSEPTGFAGHPWGTTRAQIIAAEGEPIRETGKLMIYEGFVSGLETLVIYSAPGGRLTSGNYIVQTPTSDGQALADYERVRARLTEKYGTGQDATEWYDDTFRSDRVTALTAGDVKFFTVWVLDGGRIGISLQSRNYETEMMIGYVSAEALAEPDDDGGL